MVGSRCSPKDSQESSTPQFKSINSLALSLLQVQLSHPYMSTGKTIALTRWTLVGKVTSLLLNILSRLLITFLPRSRRLLISWLQSPSAVILEPQITGVYPVINHKGKEHEKECMYNWINFLYGRNEHCKSTILQNFLAYTKYKHAYYAKNI